MGLTISASQSALDNVFPTTGGGDYIDVTDEDGDLKSSLA